MLKLQSKGKNGMPLEFKEAHLYNGYMSKWAKLTPYGMENEESFLKPTAKVIKVCLWTSA